MGTLFGALNSSLDAIQAFQTALNISQNNVSNANTPGYARQVANLESLPFDPSGGLTGGVQAGPTQEHPERIRQSGGSKPTLPTGELQRSIHRVVLYPGTLRRLGANRHRRRSQQSFPKFLRMGCDIRGRPRLSRPFLARRKLWRRAFNRPPPACPRPPFNSTSRSVRRSSRSINSRRRFRPTTSPSCKIPILRAGLTRE